MRELLIIIFQCWWAYPEKAEKEKQTEAVFSDSEDDTEKSFEIINGRYRKALIIELKG